MSQRIPSSALQPNPPPARKKANKPPVDPSAFRKIETSQAEIAKAVQGVDISIQDGIDAFGKQGFLDAFVPVPLRPSQINALPPPNIFGG